MIRKTVAGALARLPRSDDVWAITAVYYYFVFYCWIPSRRWRKALAKASALAIARVCPLHTHSVPTNALTGIVFVIIITYALHDITRLPALGGRHSVRSRRKPGRPTTDAINAGRRNPWSIDRAAVSPFNANSTTRAHLSVTTREIVDDKCMRP